MIRLETTAPVLPETPTQPAIDPEPGRRLSPDKVCPDQQSRVVRRIIRELP